MIAPGGYLFRGKGVWLQRKWSSGHVARTRADSPPKSGAEEAGLPRVFLNLLLVPPAVLMAGCLVVTHQDRVIREDEPRVAVEFESHDGMVQFYRTVSRRSDNGARERGRTSFNIPFIVSANTRKVLARSAFFNDQVRIADINGDGTLSDTEVWAYGGR